MKNYRFCPTCKSNLITIREHDDQYYRCPKCGFVHYANPLPSAVAFVWNKHNEILLIKRGVEPGKGKWALPSGFIEQTELPEHAALRELKEETNLVGRIRNLINIYTQPTNLYGNVLLIAYDIEVITGRLKSGSDTRAAKFFPADQLPHIPFQSHCAIIRDGLAKRRPGQYLVEVLKSKITEATVTRAVLYYKGSMGIDAKIMEAANIAPGEKVHVLNYNNGERLETYVIEEKAGSGKFVLYGPASLKGKVGDRLCILAYAFTTADEIKNIESNIVILDKKNRIKKLYR